MADRFLELSDGSDSDTSDDNNRTVRTFREQKIQWLQEHRMAEMQLAEHGAATASVAAVMEHQRDLVHLREKGVQRLHQLHREKELKKLERLSIEQHHQQREEDLQQEELHRSRQQMVAAAVQSMKEDVHREKEMLEALERRAKAAKRLAILESEEEIAKHLLAVEQARFEKLSKNHLQHHLHIEQQQRIASVQPARARDHFFQGFHHETQQELDEIDNVILPSTPWYR